MAGSAVTFLSVTLAHVILRLRVAREIIGFLSVTDTYIHTYIHTYKLFPRCDTVSQFNIPNMHMVSKKSFTQKHYIL